MKGLARPLVPPYKKTSSILTRGKVLLLTFVKMYRQAALKFDLNLHGKSWNCFVDLNHGKS